MKLNSRHIIFLLIICILFSIAAVSASDNQAIDVDNGDELAIDKDNSEFLLMVCLLMKMSIKILG